MFWTKPRHPLKGVVFTDGCILGICRTTEDTLTLDFEDYCKSQVRITFDGVSSVSVSGSVEGLEIMRASVCRSGDSWVLELRDDDDEIVLIVKHEKASVVIT